MIPRSHITAWRSQAPWPLNEQVEQDLVISRALVEIYSDSILRDKLAFRGGTALHKLYLKPQVRYSEDIDLVQTDKGAIGALLDRLRIQLSFLGLPRIKQSQDNNSVIYRFDSEIAPVVPLRLKIEINCREHFSVLGFKHLSFSVNSGWFLGNCKILTYDPNELLGTKLRALFQRKKGRDLFDLWHASHSNWFDAEKITEVFKRYLAFQKLRVTRKQFVKNLEGKINDPDFTGDTAGLLHPAIRFNMGEAFEWIRENLLSYLD